MDVDHKTNETEAEARQEVPDLDVRDLDKFDGIPLDNLANAAFKAACAHQRRHEPYPIKRCKVIGQPRNQFLLIDEDEDDFDPENPLPLVKTESDGTVSTFVLRTHLDRTGPNMELMLLNIKRLAVIVNDRYNKELKKLRRSHDIEVLPDLTKLSLSDDPHGMAHEVPVDKDDQCYVEQTAINNIQSAYPYTLYENILSCCIDPDCVHLFELETMISPLAWKFIRLKAQLVLKQWEELVEEGQDVASLVNPRVIKHMTELAKGRPNAEGQLELVMPFSYKYIVDEHAFQPVTLPTNEVFDHLVKRGMLHRPRFFNGYTCIGPEDWKREPKDPDPERDEEQIDIEELKNRKAEFKYERENLHEWGIKNGQQLLLGWDEKFNVVGRPITDISDRVRPLKLDFTVQDADYVDSTIKQIDEHVRQRPESALPPQKIMRDSLLYFNCGPDSV